MMLRKTILGIMVVMLSISAATMLLNVQLIRSVNCDSDVDYLLYEHHGGWWCDAEKTADDTEDDLMCWTLTATNVLEWTGWGLVGGMWNTDEMFEYSQDYWDDHSGSPPPVWHWWFDGTGADHAGGGNFWPTYTWTNYYHAEGTASQVMTAIDNWLHAGYGIGLFVGDGAHYITCWGFRYDDSVNKATDPDDYYLGVWVTNSDDDKWWVGSAADAPNTLDYYPVNWNGTHWEMGDGFEGWYIGYVCAFEPFPSTRPVANAGGPYTGDEGSAITFDGSGSSDADGDTLQYRWDFDPDWNDWIFDWDTVWSSSPTATHTWYDDYSGTVALQVYDGHMLDIDTATVTVDNEAPSVDAGSDQTVDEGETVSFSGSLTDPGTDDTHTIEWDFGDGSPTVTGTQTPTHVYCDNGVYTVTLTVTDDDGGVGTDTLTVTVNNVAPTVDAGSDQTVDEGDTVNFSGSFSDPGTCDTHTIEWDFGDGSPTVTGTQTPTHVYGDNGAYTVTLTVTDDDGDVGTDTLTVTVNNVAPSIDLLELVPPNADNPEFILPVVHEPGFTGEATDPGSDDLTFTWDWGDGSPTNVTIYYNDGVGPDPYPSPGGNYPFSETDSAGHVYALPGTYTVTLTVEDDDGGVVSTTYEIKVLNPEEAKEIINEYIQSLPDEAFRNNPVQKKKAFRKMFSALDDMLADEEYWGVATASLQNIRQKADGTVDGSPKNDWITDATAQEHICWKIDALTAYLQTIAIRD